MTNRLKCVDLFSGLGGFSESPYQRGWEVVRVDNDDGFAHIPETIIEDVFSLDPRDLIQEPDLMVISPPCECFSLMAVGHYWKNGKPAHPDTLFAIQLVKRALEIKDALKPKYWVVENPNGMMIHVLGPPIVRTWWAAWYSDCDSIIRILKNAGYDSGPLKPTNLWGVLPAIDFPTKPKNYIRAKSGSNEGIQDARLSAAERSLVPFKFSEALAIAIEQNLGGQISLEDYFSHV